MRGWRIINSKQETRTKSTISTPTTETHSATVSPILLPFGLRNEGNSCFFNALVQTFFHASPLFRTAVIGLVGDSADEEDSGNTISPSQIVLRENSCNNENQEDNICVGYRTYQSQDRLPLIKTTTHQHNVTNNELPLANTFSHSNLIEEHSQQQSVLTSKPPRHSEKFNLSKCFGHNLATTHPVESYRDDGASCHPAATCRSPNHSSVEAVRLNSPTFGLRDECLQYPTWKYGQVSPRCQSTSNVEVDKNGVSQRDNNSFSCATTRAFSRNLYPVPIGGTPVLRPQSASTTSARFCGRSEPVPSLIIDSFDSLMTGTEEVESTASIISESFPEYDHASERLTIMRPPTQRSLSSLAHDSAPNTSLPSHSVDENLRSGSQSHGYLKERYSISNYSDTQTNPVQYSSHIISGASCNPRLRFPEFETTSARHHSNHEDLRLARRCTVEPSQRSAQSPTFMPRCVQRRLSSIGSMTTISDRPSDPLPIKSMSCTSRSHDSDFVVDRFTEYTKVYHDEQACPLLRMALVKRTSDNTAKSHFKDHKQGQIRSDTYNRTDGGLSQIGINRPSSRVLNSSTKIARLKGGFPTSTKSHSTTNITKDISNLPQDPQTGCREPNDVEYCTFAGKYDRENHRNLPVMSISDAKSIPVSTPQSMYESLQQPLAPDSYELEQNLKRQTSNTSQSSTSSSIQVQSSSPFSPLLLLKLSFIEMSFSLSSNITIFNLYESVMGSDDTQQDAIEVRGKFWDLLKQCLSALPNQRNARALGSIMKSQFEGVLYEISDRLGESRQHTMDFFTLDLTLTTDTTLEEGLTDITRDAHGSYSRLSYDIPEVLCINLNRFSLSVSDSSIYDQTASLNTATSTPVSKNYHGGPGTSLVSMDSQSSVALVSKRKCRCDFSELINVKELRRPNDPQRLAVEKLEMEYDALYAAYEANVEDLRASQESLHDVVETEKLWDLLDEQEELKKELCKKEYDMNQAKRRNNMLYQLAAVIVHRGSPNAGHYWTYVRQSNNSSLLWYRLDDERTALTPFSTMYREAIGASSSTIQPKANTLSFTDISSSFFPSVDPLELEHDVASAEQWWNSNQSYTTQSTAFTNCPFVNYIDISESVRDCTSGYLETAAYCLIYTRYSNDKGQSNSSTSLIGTVSSKLYPSQISSQYIDDCSFLINVCRSPIIATEFSTMMEKNRSLLQPLVDTFVERLIRELDEYFSIYAASTKWCSQPNSVIFSNGLHKAVTLWSSLFPCPPQLLPSPFNEILLECLGQRLEKYLQSRIPFRNYFIQTLLTTNFHCLHHAEIVF